MSNNVKATLCYRFCKSYLPIQFYLKNRMNNQFQNVMLLLKACT